MLKFLFNMKRQGRIELIYVSKNAEESSRGMKLIFPNVVLSGHDQPTVTEDLSVALWGKYFHSYPVLQTVKPPVLFFSLRSAENWTISTEERPRVREVDLNINPGILSPAVDLLAVKTTVNESIYLVPSAQFLRSKGIIPLLTG